MALQGQPIPLPFPLGGVAESAPYAAGPGQTVVRPDQLLNMRAYDALERRARGGQRTGIEKQAADQINGTNQVQLIDNVVSALDLVQAAGWGDQYTAPSIGSVDLNNSRVVWSPTGNRIAGVEGGAPARTVDVYGYSGLVVSDLGAAHSKAVGPSSNSSAQHVGWNSSGTVIFVAVYGSSSDDVLEAWAYDESTGFGSLLDSVTLASTTSGIALAVHPNDGAVVVWSETSPYLEAWPWDGSNFGAKYTSPTVTFGGAIQSGVPSVEFHPDGDVVFYSSANNLDAIPFDLVTGWGSEYSSPTVGTGTINGGITVHPNGGFVVRVPNTSGSAVEVLPFDKVTGWGSRTTTAATVGVRCPRFNNDGSFVLLAETTAGDSVIYPFSNDLGTALTTPGTVGEAMSCDWAPNGLSVALWGSSNFQAYAFTPAGINPTAREVRLLAMAGGSLYRSNTALDTFTVVSSGGSAFDASNPQPMGDTAFQKYFIVDGITANYQYLDFADNTLKDWASALTAGSLPQGTTDSTLCAKIIATYGVRVVLAGLKEEPQNWFMSRAGDPFDYDYSPATTDALQPVAGNNSDAGELGDILTALAPYQDDVLIMGGANSIWVMRGDPAAGGRIDNITRGIGIVGPQAWCFDTGGTFYFFGLNGLYRMTAGGGAPQLVSKNKLDKTFSDIDITAKTIRLVYDVKWQGVGIFISDPMDPSGAAEHWFYDERRDAFFRDQLPQDIGPSAVGVLTDVNPENNNILIGGFDGYIRRFDDDAMNDDGTAIDSFVRFPVIHPQLTMGQFQLTDLQIHTDQNGGASTALDIYRGHTPQEAALASTAAFTKTLAAGRNLPVRKRLRANSLQVRLRNNTAGQTWAYEAGNLVIAGVGRQRATL